MNDQVIILSDVRIPMRDGVGLSAEVYLPPEENGVYPAILIRSPYGNDKSEYDRLRLQAYVDAGFAVVYQMVRGRGKSGGEFSFFFAEGQDGYDTIEWIAAQPWCNGRVGMDGGSYLGTAQYLAARMRPPHLVCILPSVPAGDFFNEIPYIGGGLQLDWAVTWNVALDGIDVEDREEEIYRLMKTVRPLKALGKRIGITGKLFYDVLDRDVFIDRLKDLYFTSAHFKAIESLPVMTVTSWFDGDQAGSLFYWDGIEKNFADKRNAFLIIGPWDHAGCYLGGEPKKGLLEFGETARLDTLAERIVFFESYLKQTDGGLSHVPRVRLFVTGINQWRDFDQYPPASTITPYYLHSGGNANTSQEDGRLSTVTPADEAVDTFCYDPNNPVDYQQYGEDVSTVELRPDILVFTTDPLKAPVEIIGKIHMILHAASDALDTDFVVRIIDVFPDGRPVNLSHGRGVIRARYRNSFETAELLKPGRVETYRIRLNDLGHVFQKGHCIRLEVTSSLFPLIDPNPNTGGELATETKTKVAHQSVYHDQCRPSHLLLPVMLNSNHDS
ncbi:MAG: CocE/NonD family hydrolase, partial [Deltaproteobacteria bacterium]|nr:CocE/NonD family hydrolase [Deltaproteobacteria bacterium]